jgi:hypothetical protein
MTNYGNNEIMILRRCKLVTMRRGRPVKLTYVSNDPIPINAIFAIISESPALLN